MYNALPCKISVKIHNAEESLTFPGMCGSVRYGHRDDRGVVVYHGQIRLFAKDYGPPVILPKDDVIVPRDVADEMRRHGMRHSHMVFCPEATEGEGREMIATGIVLQESISTMPPTEQNATTKGE